MKLQGLGNQTEGQGNVNQGQWAKKAHPAQAQTEQLPEVSNQGQKGAGLPVGFQPIEGKQYKIESWLAQNLVLDLSQNPADENKLLVWDYHGGENQRFVFTSVGDGKWCITCVQNGMTIHAPDVNLGSRKVYCDQANIQSNECWEILSVTDQKYEGYNVVSFRSSCGHSLDVEGSNWECGTNVIIWPHHGGDNQIWILQEIE